MHNLEESFNDHQRIEQLKKLFKKYGSQGLIAIVVLLLSIAAWQYRQYYKTEQSDKAAQVYFQLLNSINQEDKATTQAAANDLMQHYALTPYAKIGAFALAKQAVKDSELEAATGSLRWIIAHPEQAFLVELAQVRLAQILLSQKQAQAALDVLRGAGKIYPVATSMVKAQALLALNLAEDAGLELQKSIDMAPLDSSMRPILEMMLNDL